MRTIALVLLATFPLMGLTAQPTMGEAIARSIPADWRPLDPANTLYMELPGGRVVIELAPTQWGDAQESGPAVRPIRTAKKTLPGEFTVAAKPTMPFVQLPDVDGYAPQVGFSDGLPAARDPTTGRAWPCHCYGMVGVGRDEAADSGGGSSLYAVIGNSPRHLDRNITLVGRVVQSMERAPIPVR